jgi:hypothetical protein
MHQLLQVGTSDIIELADGYAFRVPTAAGAIMSRRG